MVLVTGASGFIGKHLVGLLLQRGGKVHALVRKASQERFKEAARARWGADARRVVTVTGDITEPCCGVSDKDLERWQGKGEHLFHLAAVYDMNVDEESARRANVDGTRHVVELANRIGARLQYVSSIAVAGDYDGMFREDMFDEGQRHHHPYFATKYEGEALVRREAKVPFRIYRPGIVIGSSETGEAEKIDGPYYMFKLIQRLRNALPQWFPLIGLEGGKLPLVPVDYVARAMDHIAHADGLDNRAFHLVDSKPLSFGDSINQFCKAAHAPQFTARLDQHVVDLIPRGVFQLLGNVPTVRAARRETLAGLGIPDSALDYVNWRTTFDDRDACHALEGSGIECPRLADYAWKIWDYWERHMDPDLFRDHSLAGVLKDKVVLITGASSGIGKTVAKRVGQAGAVTLLVARSADKLAETRDEIIAEGGRAEVVPCDLSDPAHCDELVDHVLHEHGQVDVLINNAGRSIRRSVNQSYDRFHDFQRTVQLNYFGSLKLILGFLPGMRERKSGHIINVSSIGVQTNAPRFSAYVASKAALDAFSRSIATEIVSDRIAVTTVYMPLVRTPMIAPTKIYDAFPAITPDEAADLIVGAILTQPKTVSTRLGTFGQVLHALVPKVADRVLNIGYRLFPDSKPRDRKAEPPRVSIEGVAFAHLLRGIHW